ncbi:ATP-dependent RecD-like DNA helicase [Bacillaceae bacterium Marseille-Q3522]|nr:ATP-dependent RecD-like DNA helicase [Bacillaceae bacterium Marseille-Q3522]
MEQQQSLPLFQNQENFIKGRLLVTIFHNEQNFYTVLRIRVEETSEQYNEKEAVITGYFPKIHEQETYIFYGGFKKQPRFGLQFHANHFRKDIPQTKQGVIAYLSSELFKGIGEKTAQKIVQTLGENAISKILQQPSLLDTIPKLSPDNAKMLYDKLMEHQGLEQAMILLNQYGFGPQLAMKIYQTYKEETVEIVQHNPYKLVEDIEGIGFRRADELGARLGITGNHPSRIRAACMYLTEKESIQEGHVFLEAEDLLQDAKLLLEANEKTEISFEDISNEIIKLAEEKKLVTEERRVYLPSLYYSEKGLVTNISRMLQQTEYEQQFPGSEFLLALARLEERIHVQYAPSQKEAIQTALSSPFLILTGGPGTGKTTVIKGIVELYGELHGCSLNPKDYREKHDVFPFLLCAPTGRAAKRMAESTGLPAVTIHRLLGFTGNQENEMSEDHSLEGKIVIVDEASMVDIWLAHQLFKALPEHIQVILVGDEDQLPSVGPGQVLKDLLRSKCIPTVTLTDIYRQDEGSSIIDLAHEIKRGKLPSDITMQKKDRSFIRCVTNQVSEVIEKVVKNACSKGYSAKDIQVLAPMYRGTAGIDRLNKILQEIFNPNPHQTRKEMNFGDGVYRVGDKVLQLINQPEKHIFNGDMGEIISILFAKENPEKTDIVVVSFDGNEVTYTKQELNQITLAYCCSVHKSQGSEFPIVILPIVKSYYRMLRRNLIYTAITRSKKFLILCGEEEAMELGVKRADEQTRKTTLMEKLQAAILPEKNYEETVTYEEEIMKVDPMIGMENITPYHFLETI